MFLHFQCFCVPKPGNRGSRATLRIQVRIMPNERQPRTQSNCLNVWHTTGKRSFWQKSETPQIIHTLIFSTEFAFSVTITAPCALTQTANKPNCQLTHSRSKCLMRFMKSGTYIPPHTRDSNDQTRTRFQYLMHSLSLVGLKTITKQ